MRLTAGEVADVGGELRRGGPRQRRGPGPPRRRRCRRPCAASSGEGADRDGARRSSPAARLLLGFGPARLPRSPAARRRGARPRRPPAAPGLGRWRRGVPGPARPAWPVRGARPRPRGRRAAGGRRVGREQLPVEPLQLGAGIHAKFVRDHLLRLAYASSASARRPASSSARISSAQNRSRSGCSATSPRSSGMTCAARPHARSASMRSSVAASHSSAARSACVLEQRGRRDVGEQRPAPQPERLAEQRGGRAPRSPAASALLPSVTSDSNC